MAMLPEFLTTRIPASNTSGRGGARTRTDLTVHGILSPVRLPIPPLGRSGTSSDMSTCCASTWAGGQHRVRYLSGWTRQTVRWLAAARPSAGMVRAGRRLYSTSSRGFHSTSWMTRQHEAE